MEKNKKKNGPTVSAYEYVYIQENERKRLRTYVSCDDPQKIVTIPRDLEWQIQADAIKQAAEVTTKCLMQLEEETRHPTGFIM